MGEVTDRVGHTPERLKQMKDHLERLKAQGVEAIDWSQSEPPRVADYDHGGVSREFAQRGRIYFLTLWAPTSAA